MRRALPLLAGLVLAACGHSTPSEPESRPVLFLSYTGPCGLGSVLVSVDGVPAGRVRIPGTTSFDVGPGPHDLQVGTSPAVRIAMPADEDLVLVNQPSACP